MKTGKLSGGWDINYRYISSKHKKIVWQLEMGRCRIFKIDTISIRYSQNITMRYFTSRGQFWDRNHSCSTTWRFKLLRRPQIIVSTFENCLESLRVISQIHQNQSGILHRTQIYVLTASQPVRCAHGHVEIFDNKTDDTIRYEYADISTWHIEDIGPSLVIVNWAHGLPTNTLLLGRH